MTKKIKTTSNILLDNFYGNEQSAPGKFPFRSGIYDDMYRGKLWTMRQYAGFTSCEESNKRYKYLLSKGVKGLSVAFDLPTQTGYDSDHDLSDGEIGKVGVPISTIDDMRTLLKDIPLDKISISMTINSTAIIMLSFLIAVAKENKINLNDLRGTIQNDILKEYIARGTYIFPPNESMKLITDIFEYCSKEVPKWNTISISGYHIREAGANAIEELAFTFSNAIEYVNHAINAGLDPNVFGKQISFFFNCHNHFFEEISKFRAARVLWANIMKNKFGVTDQKALMCRFHTQTAGSTLTAQDIDNNIIRTTLQASAAVIGGTQSLHTNSKDEALSLPTDKSAETALRTQQIIGYESGIPDVADPMAGSYYVESLTEQMIDKTNQLINEIEELGGAVKAIENSFQQGMISKSAYQYQIEIDKKERVIVGVNDFKSNDKQIAEIQKIDKDAINKQLNRLKEFKKNRNEKLVEDKLNALKNKLNSTKNIMSSIIECVEANATLGEISNILKEKFGEYQG
ncbi:MAG: methylmalonyl-CoA mutase [Candidatus Marinimicrobia bacterium]|nr:methylmalonyl-CoA mutase [Candidatus Neomarinimicrobiota bacterium]|tara:strand:- start:6058 stop:7602 length:1545 start_codon:yes stop_codon:yes gene_type:complete